jgi:hypothetical protein
MSDTRSVYAALLAMALSACAHTSAEPSTTTVSNVRVESYQATGEAAQGSASSGGSKTRFAARTLSAGGPFVSGEVVASLPDCDVWTTSDVSRCDTSDFRIMTYELR